MPQGNINGDLASHGHITGRLTIPQAGTSDYEELTNKPSINGVELVGNVTDAELNINYNNLINKPSIPQPYIPINYSTEEQNTGIKWIDGKDIYQKSISMNLMSTSSSWRLFQHDISNIDKIVAVETFLFSLDTAYQLPQYRNSSSYIVFGADKTNIQYINTWITDGGTIYCTLRYTKTEG